MTVAVHLQRKAVQIEWDTNVVQGRTASVSAAKPDASEVIEKKTVNNHGHATLTFPQDYEGDCFIVVQGSKPGSEADEGTIHIA